MSKRTRQKVIQKLEEIPADESVLFMFRNGRTKVGHVYDIDQNMNGSYSLYYSVGGLPEMEGSKVDPRDWLPSIPFHELGYVQVQSTGKKVSLMSFRKLN